MGRKNHLVSKRSLRSADFGSEKRPKRVVQNKTVDDSVGLSRQEEQELNKALYASLNETRRTKSLPSLIGLDIADFSTTVSSSGSSSRSASVTDKPSTSKPESTTLGKRRSLRGGTPLPKRLFRSDSTGSSENDNLNIDESSKDSIKSSSSSGNGSKRKIHAQRKFAQGCSLPGTPASSPTKASSTPVKLLSRTPKTEDFLTFLCLRGSPALPPHLDFFNFSREELPLRDDSPKTSSSGRRKLVQEGGPDENSSTSSGVNEEVAAVVARMPSSAGKSTTSQSRRSAARASAGTLETARGIVSLRQGLQRKVSSSSWSSSSSSPRLCRSSPSCLLPASRQTTNKSSYPHKPKYYFMPEKSSPSEASGVLPREFTPPSKMCRMGKHSPLIYRPSPSELAAPSSSTWSPASCSSFSPLAHYAATGASKRKGRYSPSFFSSDSSCQVTYGLPNLTPSCFGVNQKGSSLTQGSCLLYSKIAPPFPSPSSSPTSSPSSYTSSSSCCCGIPSLSPTVIPSCPTGENSFQCENPFHSCCRFHAISTQSLQNDTLNEVPESSASRSCNSYHLYSPQPSPSFHCASNVCHHISYQTPYHGSNSLSSHANTGIASSVEHERVPDNFDSNDPHHNDAFKNVQNFIQCDKTSNPVVNVFDPNNSIPSLPTNSFALHGSNRCNLCLMHANDKDACFTFGSDVCACNINNCCVVNEPEKAFTSFPRNDNDEQFQFSDDNRLRTNYIALSKTGKSTFEIIRNVNRDGVGSGHLYAGNGGSSKGHCSVSDKEDYNECKTFYSSVNAVSVGCTCNSCNRRSLRQETGSDEEDFNKMVVRTKRAVRKRKGKKVRRKRKKCNSCHCNEGKIPKLRIRITRGSATIVKTFEKDASIDNNGDTDKREFKQIAQDSGSNCHSFCGNQSEGLNVNVKSVCVNESSLNSCQIASGNLLASDWQAVDSQRVISKSNYASQTDSDAHPDIDSYCGSYNSCSESSMEPHKIVKLGQVKVFSDKNPSRCNQDVDHIDAEWEEEEIRISPEKDTYDSVCNASTGCGVRMTILQRKKIINQYPENCIIPHTESSDCPQVFDSHWVGHGLALHKSGMKSFTDFTKDKSSLSEDDLLDDIIEIINKEKNEISTTRRTKKFESDDNIWRVETGKNESMNDIMMRCTERCGDIESRVDDTKPELSSVGNRCAGIINLNPLRTKPEKTSVADYDDSVEDDYENDGDKTEKLLKSDSSMEIEINVSNCNQFVLDLSLPKNMGGGGGCETEEFSEGRMVDGSCSSSFNSDSLSSIKPMSGTKEGEQCNLVSKNSSLSLSSNTGCAMSEKGSETCEVSFIGNTYKALTSNCSLSKCVGVSVTACHRTELSILEQEHSCIPGGEVKSETETIDKYDRVSRDEIGHDRKGIKEENGKVTSDWNTVVAEDPNPNEEDSKSFGIILHSYGSLCTGQGYTFVRGKAEECKFLSKEHCVTVTNQIEVEDRKRLMNSFQNTGQTSDDGCSTTLATHAQVKCEYRYSSTKNGYSTTENGYSTTENGYSTTENGYSTTENGYSTTENGYYVTENGYSTTENGHSITENGHSITENGYSTTENGYSFIENGHSTTENGYSMIENGHSITENGYSTTENGHSITENGYSTLENGHSTTENGHSTTVATSSERLLPVEDPKRSVDDAGNDLSHLQSICFSCSDPRDKRVEESQSRNIIQLDENVCQRERPFMTSAVDSDFQDSQDWERLKSGEMIIRSRLDEFDVSKADTTSEDLDLTKVVKSRTPLEVKNENGVQNEGDDVIESCSNFPEFCVNENLLQEGDNQLCPVKKEICSCCRDSFPVESLKISTFDCRCDPSDSKLLTSFEKDNHSLDFQEPECVDSSAVGEGRFTANVSENEDSKIPSLLKSEESAIVDKTGKDILHVIMDELKLQIAELRKEVQKGKSETKTE